MAGNSLHGRPHTRAAAVRQSSPRCSSCRRQQPRKTPRQTPPMLPVVPLSVRLSWSREGEESTNPPFNSSQLLLTYRLNYRKRPYHRNVACPCQRLESQLLSNSQGTCYGRCHRSFKLPSLEFKHPWECRLSLVGTMKLINENRISILCPTTHLVTSQSSVTRC